MEEADSYGSLKSLREVILYDNEDHSMGFLTVWENLLDELTEETLYLFQNLITSLKNYYGSKLMTAKSTIVSDEGEVTYTSPHDAINNYIELDKKLNSGLQLMFCQVVRTKLVYHNMFTM